MEVTMNTQTTEVHTAEKINPKRHNLIASDRVEGTAVRRLNGPRIGCIQRLMIDKISGNVAYAVLSFGGFLGLGQKHFPIPWARLKYDLAEEAYVVDLSDEELSRAPGYAADEEFDWGDRSQEVVLHRYYKSPHYWGV
jgi:PRC-barrel domain